MSVLALMLLVSCSEEQPRFTPEAIEHMEEYSLGEISWSDPYGYMLDLEHPDTRRYIQDEAQYFQDNTDSWESGIRLMMKELNTQLPNDRKTMPVVKDGVEYYSEIKAGGQYPVFYRRAVKSDKSPEVLLDLNELSNGSDYYSVGGFAVSTDEDSVAFTEDRTGNGRYTLRVRHLESGDISTIGQGVAASLAWHGESLLSVDASSRSVISRLPDGGQVVIYQEPDPAFSVSVRSARDPQKIVITSESHRSTEIRILSNDGALKLLAPRKNGHRYRIIADHDQTTVLTNYQRPGYGIATVTKDQTDPDGWHFFELEQAGSIKDFERNGEHLLLQVRYRLRDELVLLDTSSGSRRTIAASGAGEQYRLMQPEPAERPNFRFRKVGLTLPERRYQYDVSRGVLDEIAAEQAPANYHADRYETQERWLTVRDGTSVPVTLLFKVGESLSARPLYLSSYGAYGVSLPMVFDPTRLPLLDRGFVLGIVHVRGGGDLGDGWHALGRHQHKKNTFNDLIDVTSALVQSGVGDPDLLAARGASAGGTTIGVVANEAPDLFKVLVAEVPFVDVLTSLLNPGLPLSESDLLEWGDPSVASDARYLFELSPYHQVRDQAYPHLLVNASRNDGRVGLHEALKWLANIRQHSTGTTLQIIDIEENSGHLGASDQYLKRRRQALEYQFVLRGLGLEG